ncbi:MAG TPA: M48 family metallopeptidase [Tepidisphaeraceae bacterium]|nr:M48 family metallopeptidase [Tepidisphaeraceae bacterium]
MKRSEPRGDFTRRTMDWAARLDVRVRAIAIRKMRRKWASCSTAGRLTFDESLLGKPGDLQDYVIVHELLHVSVPNHGKLWKSLMRAHLGDYELLEARLNGITPRDKR